MTSADREWIGWRYAGWAVLVVLTILVLVTFRDYGISHDEEVQHTYGKLLWDFYLSGFKDNSANEYKDLFRYGGMFDMLAVGLIKILPFPDYDTRHLLSGLWGVVGIWGTGMVAELIAGRRAGFLAIVMLGLTSSYYGSMFNDTKDIPFAAGMIWTVYYSGRLMAELPEIRLRTSLAYGVAFGCAFGIRVGVLMMLAYLAAGIIIWAWEERGPRTDADIYRHLGLMVLKLVPGGLLAYAIMAFFWPWGAMEPLNPLRALHFFSHHPISIDSRVFGQLINSSHTPWYYIPAYLLVKLPESTLVLLVPGLYVLFDRLWTPGLLRRQAAMVLMAALVPIAMFVVFRPTVFNGLRHFFFVVPPLTAIAACGAEDIWSRAWQRGRAWAAAVPALLLCIGVSQAAIMVALHPDQSIYYNSIAGGLKGAEDNFEMDYWSNSIREAALKLTDFVSHETGGKAPAVPYKVALCTEAPVFYEHVPKGWFQPSDQWTDSDFFVAPTQMGCDKVLEGETVITVERLGALLAVVKDRRKLPPEKKEAPPSAGPQP
jgi:hypothetical protein